MALKEIAKVRIPDRGIVRVKNGDKTYIYYTVRAYRNKDGKPTSQRVAIGKLDPESGLLIPNRNYYEVYEGRQAPVMPGTIRSCGTYAAVSGIAKSIGLEKLLRTHFQERAEGILTAAHYMLCNGNVMYYLPDWQEEHISYSAASLDSGDVSRLFGSIKSDEKTDFFRDWMKVKKPKEFVAYDVTSISSYGKMGSLEWGYNRDKEKLPQINFGMYYGEECGLPLYYRIYPGSITDKAHLRYMVEDNDMTASGKTRFVMDRGFYSAENLQYLTEKDCRFIIALPSSLKYCAALIDRHRNEIINHSECRLGKGKPYGKAFEVTELGFRMKVHLFYDPEKAVRDEAALYDEIERQENALMEMPEPPSRGLKYDRYFFINRAKDGSLAFRRNPKAIDCALSRCGFFFIAETDFTKSTAEVLDIYRRRDMVEKSFDDLKNDIDMHRIRCHSDAVAEGKAFVAFISLILLSQIRNKLRAYMDSNRFTFHKVVLELDKVKLISSPNSPKGCRLFNPLSKTQRDILRALALDPDPLAFV